MENARGLVKELLNVPDDYTVLFLQGGASLGFYITAMNFLKEGGKAAYIDTAVFIGDDQLDALSKLKSKEELLGDLIGLLQSPARNLLGALNSSGTTVMNLLKALEERENDGDDGDGGTGGDA